MTYRESRHGNVAILVHDARLNLVGMHHAGAAAERSNLRANVEVDLPGFEDVCGHGRETSRPVDIERLPSPEPRREHQVGISHGVIGMQMGEEGGRYIGGVQPEGRYSVLIGCYSPP